MDERSATASEGCSAAWEDSVNAYVDGDLASTNHALLFLHLSECEHCRHVLESVLAFRRLSRAENIQVPPIVDAALMARLDVLRRRAEEPEPSRSLWEAPMHVGLGKALAAAVGVLLLGAGIERMAATDPPPPPVSIIEERVEAYARDAFWRVEPVYVFYPGLTIEAEKQSAE